MTQSKHTISADVTVCAVSERTSFGLDSTAASIISDCQGGGSGLPNSDQWSIRTRAWLADDVHTAGSVDSSFTVDSTAIGARVSVQGEFTCTDEQIKRAKHVGGSRDGTWQ